MPFPDHVELAEFERAAVDFARKAGQIVLAAYGSPLAVEHKGNNRHDPVTEIDRRVEAFVTSAVAERFPDHVVLGEEGQEPASDAEYEWIVDPVDGTLNFINGLPLFAVSLGLLHHRRPVVGAILLPVNGDLLHARRGGGASRNGVPISLNASAALGSSVLAGAPGGFAYQFKARRGIRRQLGEPRSLGSIAVELAQVASGAFGYAVFQAPKIWDVAGGVPIVTEAGGAALYFNEQRDLWLPLDRFTAPRANASAQPRLRDWRQPVLVGAPALVEQVAGGLAPRKLPVMLRTIARRYRRWKKEATGSATPSGIEPGRVDPL